MVCLGCGTHIACGAGVFMYLLYDDVIFVMKCIGDEAEHEAWLFLLI